jgi:acyl-CoA synthetase (NDP forming)/RimJ/RimL family protein N-acetyltransferase
MPATGVGYPRGWEADVALRDGGTAHLRPITPADAEALQRFHLAQSPESVYLRFFAPMPRLSDRDLARFTNVDHIGRVAIVALVGDDIVGVGRYDRVNEREAEVAFNIADAHQGRGLGSVLLEHLAAAARENGIHRFVAEVLPQNRKMVQVFREAGYEVTHHFDDGVISLAFDIDPTDRSRAVMEAREHRAEASSLRTVLNPRSVVVVGASRSPDTIGARLLRHLVEGGFPGPVYAVNPEAFELQGVQVFSRVGDVPGPVDLAVVAVPAPAVLDVVRDCGRSGVRALVVVSSGFAETGPEGLARQRELVRVSRAHGMRVIGPNSFGLLNTDARVRLNASLAPELPQPGGLGLFSQSGALGVAVLASASERGLGVSSFVSAGNRADVSGNDCMQYWEEDPATSVVGLYLESIGNPRKFSRIARRLSRSKPVLVVKSGISGYGVPPGHAVRATRAPREALDAMLRQAGVIRVENLHQLFDVAQVLVHQPLPAGQRVGVVGNSDALAALVADAAVSWGLEIGAEPLTLHPEASADDVRAALRRAFSDDRLDAVVACFVPPLAAVDADVVRALAETSAGSDKPSVACLLGMRGLADVLVGVGDSAGGSSAARAVPAYPTPEDAVRALAAVVRYAGWRRRDPGRRIDPPGTDPAAARALVDRLLAGVDHPSGVRLGHDDVTALLACYGVRLWPAERVTGADEAVAAAERLGWPVAVKTTAERLRHRQDLGGVRLDVSSPEELRTHVREISRRAGGEAGFVVQPMAPGGVACVLRTMEDAQFGPVVSFGLAGDAWELLGDVAHRIPPLTDVDVADLVRSVRAAPRLTGYRGAPPTDVAALEDVIARVAQLADDLPEVAELEVNPVLVGERGAHVVGATVRLARPSGRTDSGRRTLPS